MKDFQPRGTGSDARKQQSCVCAHVYQFGDAVGWIVFAADVTPADVKATKKNHFEICQLKIKNPP